VVIVPFFISDGLHSYEDIPRLLGIVYGHPERREAKSKAPAVESLANFSGSPGPTRDSVKMTTRSVFRQNPYHVENRSLFYAPSIGTDYGFADLIIEQTNLAVKS
jgi:sirohydrochlorin cobaltochelatase